MAPEVLAGKKNGRVTAGNRDLLLDGPPVAREPYTDGAACSGRAPNKKPVSGHRERQHVTQSAHRPYYCFLSDHRYLHADGGAHLRRWRSADEMPFDDVASFGEHK